MSALIVETSAWLAYFQGEENPLIEMGLEALQVRVPAIVPIEILGNSLVAKDREQLEKFFQKIPVLNLNVEQSIRAGKLKADLESRGVGLSARDALIVQSVLDEKAALVTKDPYFLDLQRYIDIKIYI